MSRGQKAHRIGSPSSVMVMESSDVTRLLRDASRGDRQALDEVVPLVYDTLRRLAHRALREERRGHTLSTTALAHEAFLELQNITRIEWQDRSHFFAVAARAMRRVLVDYAVRRNAQKRGGGVAAVDLETVVFGTDDRLEEMLALNEALARLEAVAPSVVRVVECRVFVGMTIDETADALRLSPATVKRHWSAGRAWLNRELSIEVTHGSV
jgi:RNA polymerase sigma factor (TIGR02999 family)